jgi:hypothetical protein
MARQNIPIISIALSALLLAGCASTLEKAPPIKRISPEELERIMPTPAPNLSLDEIVRLSKAGTSPELIIEKIKATNSLYDLTPSQSLDLSKQGVDAKVLDYIHSRHEQAVRDGVADEINKREKAKRQDEERLRREYQLRYQPYYDPFWGYGYGPYWGPYWGSPFFFYGPSFRFHYHHR